MPTRLGQRLQDYRRDNQTSVRCGNQGLPHHTTDHPAESSLAETSMDPAFTRCTACARVKWTVKDSLRQESRLLPPEFSYFCSLLSKPGATQLLCRLKMQLPPIVPSSKDATKLSGRDSSEALQAMPESRTLCKTKNRHQKLRQEPATRAATAWQVPDRPGKAPRGTLLPVAESQGDLKC